MTHILNGAVMVVWFILLQFTSEKAEQGYSHQIAINQLLRGKTLLHLEARFGL